MDYVVPGQAPEEYSEYMEGQELNKTGLFIGLYTSKADVERAKKQVDNKHKRNTLDFQQMIDKEGLDYQITAGAVNDAIEDATANEQALFGPTGAVSLGLAALGLGGGALLKRPGDISKKEHEAQLKKAGAMDPEVFKQQI